MYTRVLNNIATNSTKDDSFSWPKVESDSLPPRYDKLIESVKGGRPHKASSNPISSRHQRSNTY